MTLKDQFIEVTIQKCISGTVSYYITELYPIMSQHKNVKLMYKLMSNQTQRFQTMYCFYFSLVCNNTMMFFLKKASKVNEFLAQKPKNSFNNIYIIIMSRHLFLSPCYHKDHSAYGMLRLEQLNVCGKS